MCTEFPLFLIQSLLYYWSTIRYTMHLFSDMNTCSAFGFLCYNLWSYVQSRYWSLPELSCTLFTWCPHLHIVLFERANKFLCWLWGFLREEISRCVFCCWVSLYLCVCGRFSNTWDSLCCSFIKLETRVLMFYCSLII